MSCSFSCKSVLNTLLKLTGKIVNMGPNLYLTSGPGPFTNLHQDGNGTVSAAHLCMKGENLVLLFPHMTEAQKYKVFEILCGDRKYLYEQPHAPDGVVSDSCSTSVRSDILPLLQIFSHEEMSLANKGNNGTAGKIGVSSQN